MTTQKPTTAIDGLTPFEDWVVRRRFANDFSTSFFTLKEESGVPVYKIKQAEMAACRKIVQSLLEKQRCGPAAEGIAETV